MQLRKYTLTWSHLLSMMSVRSGFLLFIALQSSITSAKVIPIPVAKIGDADGYLMPSERVLLLIVVGQAGQIIWFLLKTIYSSFKKDKHDAEQKLDELSQVINRIDTQVNMLAQKVNSVPSRDQLVKSIEPDIKVVVYETLRQMK